MWTLSEVFPRGYAPPPEPEKSPDIWMTLTANRGLVREDEVKLTDVVLIGRATPARDAEGRPIKRAPKRDARR